MQWSSHTTCLSFGVERRCVGPRIWVQAHDRVERGSRVIVRVNTREVRVDELHGCEASGTHRRWEIALINGGNIATQGSSEDLKERYEARNVEEVYMKVIGHDLHG